MESEASSSQAMATDVPPKHDGGKRNRLDLATSQIPRPEGMSKNAHKRLLKAERQAKLRPIWKQQEREKRKAKRQRVRREQSASQAENTTPQLKQRPFNANVLIDCGFDELMTDKEIVSMTGQLSQLYSGNRKALRPFTKIIISGQGDKRPQDYAAMPFDEEGGNETTSQQLESQIASSSSDTSLYDGRIGRRFEHTLQGMWHRWNRFYLRTHGGLERLDQAIATHTGDDAAQATTLEPVCAKSDMVYLTADTDTTLDRVEEGKTYIIGGIVDRNRHKYICAKKARALGIPMARLPIPPKYLKTSSVMTINQVFAILLTYNETGDWTTTLERCLPRRKRAGKEEEQKGEAGAAESEEDSHAPDEPTEAAAQDELLKEDQDDGSEQNTPSDIAVDEDELHNK